MKVTRRALLDCAEHVAAVTDIPIFITFSKEYTQIDEYCKDGHSVTTLFNGSTRECYCYLGGMLHTFHYTHDYPI